MAWQRILLSSCLLVCSALVPSQAEENPVRKIMNALEKQGQAGKGEVFSFAAGVGVGIGIANTYLDTEGKERIFCPPKQLALFPKNFANIALRLYKDESDFFDKMENPQDVVAIAMLHGLQRTFPCKKPTNK